jgi:hypothetical protein
MKDEAAQSLLRNIIMYDRMFEEIYVMINCYIFQGIKTDSLGIRVYAYFHVEVNLHLFDGKYVKEDNISSH